MPVADPTSPRATNTPKTGNATTTDAPSRRTPQVPARARSVDSNGNEITALPLRGGENNVNHNVYSSSSRRSASPDASRSSSTASLRRRSGVQAATSNSEKRAKEQALPVKKKKRGSMLGFLTLKEPSTSAWEEFADQQKKVASQKGGRTTAVGMPGISSKKLPENVPKVNSKWDGLPPDGKKRLAERASMQKNDRASMNSSATQTTRRSEASSASGSDETQSTQRKKLGSFSSHVSQPQQRQQSHRPLPQQVTSSHDSTEPRRVCYRSPPPTPPEPPGSSEWEAAERETNVPTTTQPDAADLSWFNAWAEQSEYGHGEEDEDNLNNRNSDNDNDDKDDNADDRSDADASSTASASASHTRTRTPTPQEASPPTPRADMPTSPSTTTEPPPAITSATGTLWFDETDPDDIIFVKRAGADVLGPPIGFRKPKLQPGEDETKKPAAGGDASGGAPRTAPTSVTSTSQTASGEAQPPEPSNNKPISVRQPTRAPSINLPHQTQSQSSTTATKHSHTENLTEDDTTATPSSTPSWPLSPPNRNNSTASAAARPGMPEQWILDARENLGLGGRVVKKAEVAPWEKFEPRSFTPGGDGWGGDGVGVGRGKERGKRFSGLLGRK